MDALIGTLREAVQAFSAPGLPSQGIAARLKAQVAAVQRAGKGSCGADEACGSAALDHDSREAATVRSLLVQLGGALSALSPALHGALAAGSPEGHGMAAAEKVSEALSCIQACSELMHVTHACGPDAFRFAQCWHLAMQCGRPLLASLLQAASAAAPGRSRRSMQGRLEGEGEASAPLQAAARAAGEQLAAVHSLLYWFNEAASECKACERAHAAFAAAMASSSDAVLWLAAACTSLALGDPEVSSTHMGRPQEDPIQALTQRKLVSQILQVASAPCLLRALSQLLSAGGPSADQALAPAEELAAVAVGTLEDLLQAVRAAQFGKLASTADARAASLQHMVEVADCAEAALRMLPTLAPWLHTLGAYHSIFLRDCIQLADGCATYLHRAACSKAGESCSQDDAASLARRLRGLHTLACRLVFHLAQPGAWRALAVAHIEAAAEAPLPFARCLEAAADAPWLAAALASRGLLGGVLEAAVRENSGSFSAEVMSGIY
ncbi:hypothetical protein ABPG75_009212 [Micractinium tetrahymenae]